MKDSTAFLGVTRSARDFVWRERLTSEQAPVASAIAQRHGLPELLGRVLAARGTTLDNVDDALDPTLKNLMPDPHSMQDVEKGAGVIADAIERKDAIAVFGDYDVDGGTSSALMRLFLKSHDLDARIYIPDRIFEGYGPNAAAIESLIDEGAKLIVTVDCGTTSHEALELATARDIPVVIVDHHLAGETLPDVSAVINPNRQDDVSGLGHLCAAGVTFMLLVAVSRALKTRGYYDNSKTAAPDLLELLDLVALGTVCDVVPLRDLNRAFVTQGLKIMRHRRNIGLRALADASSLNGPPTTYHLGFLLGPRINAGGRIGDAALGARLLSGDDEIEARRIAELLDKLNGERKALESQMLEEANAKAEQMMESNPDMPILMLGGEDFHKGVVGLVASRLTDRFRRPSCVIAWEEGGQGTGSLRSISGVDIGSVVKQAVDDGLLIKGGGHAMAAGLTVERTKLDDLLAFMSDHLRESATRMRQEAELKIDGALTPASVTAELIDLLERAGPYGNGNPQPRFVFPAHRIKFAKIVGEAHIRCVLEASDGKRIDAISFRTVGTPVGDLLLGAKSMPLHIAGTLRRDEWGGRTKLEVQIMDVADPRKK